MQLFLGGIAIYRVDEGFKVEVNSLPFLRKDYDELEGNGETVIEAFADLQEKMEALPE